MCDLNSIIKFINSLNLIPSPTDGEGDLIMHITRLANAQNIPVQNITAKPYLRVPPILIGEPDAKYILVTHCDRVQENANPLNVWNNNIRNIEGKLDNTVSLAICLMLILEMKPKNTSLLITTSEESKLKPQMRGGNLLQGQGCRGFISFLEDNLENIHNENFICVDVRPLDRGGVLRTGETKKYINLGDGLVLRTREVRDNVDISADTNLLNILKQCAINNNISITEFSGGGITELGRGWEKVLQPNGFIKADFHIAWLQPPLTHYHTAHEQMSGNDIIDLCKVIRWLINAFE